jgi:antirestriction protein ArdC
MNAAFCCAPLSVNPTVRHVDYIGSCLEVLRETRAIVRRASQARRTADQLLALPRRLQQSAIWTISQATGRWHDPS